MKILGWIFKTIHIIGYCGLILLFMYIEWLYIRQSFVQIFNPFLQLKIIITMFVTPLTWILLAMSALGFFAAFGVEKMKDEDQGM